MTTGKLMNAVSVKLRQLWAVLTNKNCWVCTFNITETEDGGFFVNTTTQISSDHFSKEKNWTY